MAIRGMAILRAAGVSESMLRDLEARRKPMTIARAMALAAAMERLAAKGLAPNELETLFPALAEADLSLPQAHADAVAALIVELSTLGLRRQDAVRLARGAAQAKSVEIEGVSSAILASIPAGCEAQTAPAEAGRRADAATPRARATKGERNMTDPDKRNGAEAARVEKERERLERERERIERERERAEHERAKLERMQEELEARLERQEERLQELEDELEERMEALDDAAGELDDLEDIEVEGIEGVREMLDVVTDRMPHILRGIQESMYSPERVQAEAEAFASFYKTLVTAGMPDHEAAELTRHHFENMRSQMTAQMAHRRPTRKGRHAPGADFDPLGPSFDPLGPNFNPFGCTPPEPPRQPGPPVPPVEPAPDSDR